MALTFRTHARESAGVVILDMNGLKLINDRLGHKAGDAALIEAAARIAQIARQSDTVARLGGDEFGIVLPEVRDPDDAETVSRRIMDRLALPFEYAGQAINLSASIGFAIFPFDAEDPDSLIERADQAMYAAKNQLKRPPRQP